MADEYWTVDVLDAHDMETGSTALVKSGSLRESIFKPVRGSGTIELDEPDPEAHERALLDVRKYVWNPDGTSSELDGNGKVLRTNLARNPSVELDTVGWSIFGTGAFVSSSFRAWSGAQSVRVEAGSGASNRFGVQSVGFDPALTATANSATVRVRVWPFPSNPAGVAASIEFVRGGVTASAAVAVASLAGGWQEWSATILLAGQGVERIRVFGYHPTTWGVGQGFYVDAIHLSVTEDSATPYFDGDTPGFDNAEELRRTSPINWLNARLRIRHFKGEKMTPKGIWIPAIPAWAWDWPRRSSALEILDKTEILNRECGQWFSVGTTTNIVNLVLSIITGLGEEAVSIADSSSTLNTPLVFEPTDTWLTICNTLLTTIGHSGLIADGDGVIASSPYVAPDARTVSGTYGGNPGDLKMKIKFNDEANVFDVPNVVYCVVPATDVTPGLIGTARNDDPGSPVSTVNRGERPFTEQIEAVSQAVADATAARRLGDLSQVTRRITWEHPIDGTELDDVIRFGPLDELLALVERETKMGVGAVVSTVGRKIYTGGNSPW